MGRSDLVRPRRRSTKPSTRGGKLDREPAKFHFVSNFHRGADQYGQHATRLAEPGHRETIASLGIIAEGPNDAIAL